MRHRFALSFCVFLVCLVISITAQAQEQDPEHGYIGLYRDFERTTNCYYGGGGGAWLWVLPSERGMYRLFFNLNFPSNTTPSLLWANPTEILSYDGDDDCGWSVEFINCQYDWVWLFMYGINVNTTEPTSTNITHECFSLVLGIYHCDPEGPHAPDSLIVSSNMTFNDPECAPVPVEEHSWGAIKSLLEH